MTGPPSVTWLLPVRNGMPYLPLTLESIAEQTYREHKIIAWDNGSTDETADELRRWIPSQIRGIVVSCKPMRLAPSLAALVDMADTELCARIDADDINDPARLERQVAFMLDHPKTGVLGTQVRLIDENGNEYGEWNHPLEDRDVRWLMRWQTRLSHPSVLFRKSAVLAAGNYREFEYEDSDLWIRMSLVTEMRNLPDRLLKYRRSNRSKTGSIEDWLPVNRRCATFCASSLFPGIADSHRAMQLWEATHPYQLETPAKFWQLGALERAAVFLARQTGNPDDYFKQSSSYREQYYHLKRRILERWGLRPLLRLRRHLAARG
jgi:glycosyltransferase involved in cell wall biosynthesis